MKKHFTSLIFTILLGILSCSSVFAYDATINDIIAITESEISTNADIDFSITNNMAEKQYFYPYVAIYTGDNRLFSIQTASKEINIGETGSFSVNIPIPKDKDGVYGKIFVWEQNTIKPLSDSKQFNIELANGFDDLVITSSTTLSEDVSYNNVTLSGGTVNLNGHTMHVYGDLIQPSGTMNIGGGSLIVEGDCGIHADTDDEATIKSAEGSSTGKLYMTNENDYVFVKGDFTTNSNQGHYYSVYEYSGKYGSTKNYHNIKAGCLELKGDFYQYGTSNVKGASNNFGTGGTHKVVFSGETQQSIYFDSPTYSFFNDVDFQNTNINFETAIAGWTMKRDTVISSNVEFCNKTIFDGSSSYIYGLDLNTYKLKINGNVLQSGNVNINNGTLNISRSLIQTSGTMNVGGGSLIIGENYGIHANTIDDSIIKSAEGSSSGILNMTNENDYVLVNGNFVTNSNQGHYYSVYEYNGRYGTTTNYHHMNAGCIELKGDFYQYGTTNSNGVGNNFGTGGTHKIVFSGDKEQNIYFDSPMYSFFNDADFQNTHINFMSDVAGWTLQRDTTVSGNINLCNKTIFGGSSNYTYGLDLNGYTLTVNGDVLQSCSININKGKFSVNGELIQTSNTMNINGGNLIIENNYRIHANTTDETIIKSAEGSSSGILSMTNENDYVLVKGDFITNSNQGHYYSVYEYNGRYGTTTNYHHMNAGCIELKGGFYQYGTANSNGSSNNFGTGGTHKVVFSGDKEQNIYFDSPVYSFFNDVDFQNADINLNSPVAGWTIQRDTIIADNVEFCNKIVLGGSSNYTYGLDINGYNLLIKGNVLLNGSINTNGGMLNIDGNLLQVSDTLNIGGGSLIVNGDYGIHANTTDDSIIKSAEGSSSGILNMINENDYVLIKGNFITNSNQGHYYSVYEYNGKYGTTTNYHRLKSGLIEIQGDFYQYGTANNNGCGNNFGTGDTHTVILSGGNGQHIYFDNADYSYFNNLIVTAPLDTYIFENVNYKNLYRAYKYYTFMGNTGSTTGTYAPTGNYSREFSDLTANTSLGVTEFTHTYNSLDNNESILGAGWSFGFDTRITDMYGTYKSVKLPGGSIELFKDNNDGTFTAENSRNTLTKSSNNNYTLQTKDFIRYVYDANGFIVSSADRYGNVTNYNTNSDGNITSILLPTGEKYDLIYNDGKLVEIKDNTANRNVTFTYDNGRLIKSTNPLGTNVYYSYDDNGRLIEVKDHYENIIETVEYTADNKVSSITDVNGNKNTYTYDIPNKKTTITDSNGKSQIQYYDDGYGITKIEDAEGGISSTQYSLTNGENKYNEPKTITNRNGSNTYYEYDDNGNIVKYTNGADGSYKSYTYDQYNNVISECDENGNYTYYVYDESGCKLLKTIKPLDGKSVYTENADKESFAITELSYYEKGENDLLVNGLVKTKIEPMGENIKKTQFLYYPNGQLKEMTIVDGVDNVVSTTKYEYNNLGLIKVETASDSTKTYYEYDIIGNKTKISANNGQAVSVMAYDDMGRCIKELSPNDVENSRNGIKTSYYANGQPKVETNADGGITSYTYDIYGNISTKTMPNGAVYRYTYDSLGRQLSVSYKDVTATDFLVTDEYTYSKLSNGQSKTQHKVFYDEGICSVEESTFDYADRLIKQVKPNSAVISKTYYPNGLEKTSTDANGNMASYTYDVFGNLTEEKIPFDNNYQYKKYEYDKNGNMTKMEVSNNVSGEDSSYSVTSYEYNGRGMLTKVVNYNNGTVANVVQYAYDNMGNKVREYTGLHAALTINGIDDVSAVDDREYSVDKYAYDYLGNVISHTDALGYTEAYEYDKNGNLIKCVDKNGTETTYVYDSLNRVLKKQAGDIQYSYTYDLLGNQLSVIGNNINKTMTYDGRGNMLTETEGNINKQYTYDRQGNRLSFILTDESNNIFNTQYVYDNMGRLYQVIEDGAVVATYQYDDNGNRSSLAYSNGITSEYKYNKANYVTSLVNKNNGATISSYEYTYYLNGNPKTITEKDGVTSYTYDDLGQILTVNNKYGTVHQYSYDDYNNRISMTNTSSGNKNTVLYSYDKNSRLIEENKSGLLTMYEYDKNGNMLLKSSSNGNEVYSYDAWNRLISVQNKNGIFNYSYDDMLHRTSITSESDIKTQIWDGNNVVYEKMKTETNSYLTGINIISSSNNDVILNYIYNAHGDVVGLADSDGNIKVTYEYDEYGNQQNKDDTDSNPFRFAGEYYDVESGMYYNRARYYDTTIGRFISHDSYNGNPNDILSLNGYTYCHNNPIYYVDSTGNSVVQAMHNISVNATKTTLSQVAKSEATNAVYGLLGISNERPDYYSVYKKSLLNAALKETGLEKAYSVFSTIANETANAAKKEIKDSKIENRNFNAGNVLGNMAFNKAQNYVKNEILNGIPGGKTVYGMCQDLARGELKNNKTMQIFVTGLNYMGSSMGYDKITLDTPNLYGISNTAKTKANSLKQSGASDSAAYWAEKYYSYSETARRAPIGGSNASSSSGLSSQLGAEVKNSWLGNLLGF